MILSIFAMTTTVKKLYTHEPFNGLALVYLSGCACCSSHISCTNLWPQFGTNSLYAERNNTAATEKSTHFLKSASSLWQ